MKMNFISEFSLTLLVEPKLFGQLKLTKRYTMGKN